jgi:hypothetical protein
MTDDEIKSAREALSTILMAEQCRNGGVPGPDPDDVDYAERSLWEHLENALDEIDRLKVEIEGLKG